MALRSSEAPTEAGAQVPFSVIFFSFETLKCPGKASASMVPGGRSRPSAAIGGHDRCPRAGNGPPVGLRRRHNLWGGAGEINFILLFTTGFALICFLFTEEYKNNEKTKNNKKQ